MNYLWCDILSVGNEVHEKKEQKVTKAQFNIFIDNIDFYFVLY